MHAPVSIRVDRPEHREKKVVSAHAQSSLVKRLHHSGSKRHHMGF